MLILACRRPHCFHFADVSFNITCHNINIGIIQVYIINSYPHDTDLVYLSWLLFQIGFSWTKSLFMLFTSIRNHSATRMILTTLSNNDIHTYINTYIIISLKQSSSYQTMTYIHTFMYTYININIIMIITKFPDNIRSRLREIPSFMEHMRNIENNSSQHIQVIWHLKSIYSTFSCYLSLEYTTTVHLPQWTQLVQPTVIVLPSAVLTHAQTHAVNCAYA